MILVLENIRSLTNVGTILRTADALAIECLYFCGITPAPVDRFGNVRGKLAKISLGAERTVQWKKVRSCSTLLKRLKTAGHRIFALEQSPRSVPYHQARLKGGVSSKVVLVAGNEVSGLSKGALELSDKVLEIPMRGVKESLNVAVALAIIGFHLRYS